MGHRWDGNLCHQAMGQNTGILKRILVIIVGIIAVHKYGFQLAVIIGPSIQLAWAISTPGYHTPS